LAGILLKLGGYGFIRFSLLLFPNASAFFSPLIFLISIIGTVYSSITTLQQVDLKKVIAYSSVGHMGVVTIGIFCSSPQGILGSIYLMLAHGITSSGLFLLIGLLYDKYGTRIIKYYGGLFHTMPIFSVTFLIFTMANLGLPGTSNFIGEFLIFIGCFGINS
jgi:NADH-quinone oxidoreductase subunit M